MNNPTLTISSISSENNYIRIDGNIQEPKAIKQATQEPTQEATQDSTQEATKEPINNVNRLGRIMVTYYPKKSTTFNMEQEAIISEKGTIYRNYFVISNHMGMGSIRILEESIGLIKNGPLGPSFTPQTFTEFLTDSTGA